MCVLLLDVFKHLLFKKIDTLKTCRKSKFLRKKIWRNVLALKSTKVQVYSGKRLFWYCYLQLSFVYKTLSHISFKLFFVGEIKGFYQSSLGNEEVDFRDIGNISLSILAENWNFKKLRPGFADERPPITPTLLSYYHWKTLVPFCLRKKRPENAFLTLIVHYHKIIQKKKIMPFKTTIN